MPASLETASADVDQHRNSFNFISVIFVPVTDDDERAVAMADSVVNDLHPWITVLAQYPETNDQQNGDHMNGIESFFTHKKSSPCLLLKTFHDRQKHLECGGSIRFPISASQTEAVKAASSRSTP
jgi:hypothetical protein